MTGLLQHSDGGGFEHCVYCGARAVGPCARCQSPVCGDCCVLTEGGTKTYAICLGCDRQRGHSLQGSWARVIGWLVGPIVVLAVLVWLLSLLVGGP